MIEQQYISQIVEIVKKAVIFEWTRQGHRLTGKFEQTIEERITNMKDGVIIEGYIQDYAALLNRGVSASRIPYQRGSGRKTSQYIQGLVRYALQRMTNSRQEAERIAFAIASKHKKEGMPTKSSRRFSKTNKRTGFIDDALESVQDRIDIIIRIAVESTFDRIIQIGNENFRIAA